MAERILLVGPNLRGGGAQTVLRGWATALAERGYQVVIALTEAAEQDIPGAEVRLLGGGGRRRILRKLRELRALARESDAVIAQMPYWNLLALAAVHSISRRRRPRVIISEHNLYSGLRRILGLSLRVKATIARATYRYADAFIAVSHAVAAEGASAYRLDPRRIWVVPNMTVQEPMLTSRSETVAATADELPIVFAGRFIPQKDPYLVVEVASRLTTKGIAVSVHFFGYGPLQGALERMAADQGVTVTFHGMLSEWWAAAPPNAVMLLPSSVEGFGNVLVEAAAAGIPSVASSQALGVSDAILDGVTGVLTPNRTADALADAVLRARELRPIPDVRRWLEKFTATAGIERLEEIFKAVSR